MTAALRWVVALACCLAVVSCSGTGGSADRWADGSVHGPWLAVFDGEGTTTMRDGVVSLSPRPAAEAGETHAGLVVTTAQYRDVDFQLRVRTVAQLRKTDPPNPWEVGWVVWAYTDSTHFYYLTLKPNGWELGKADPGYPGSQRFLATGPTAFPIGKWYSVHVQQVAGALTVTVDGALLARFTDTETPYAGGALGAYVEDAAADFANLDVHAP